MRRVYRKALAPVAIVGAFWSSAIFAQEQQSIEVDAGSFGARRDILDISLSPSGEKIAYISSGVGSTEILNIIDLAGDGTPRAISANSEANTELTSCDWANEEWLVCEVFGIELVNAVLLGFTRMVSVSVEDTDIVSLTQRNSARALGARQDGGSVISLDMEGEDDLILMTSEFVPEMTTGSRLASDEDGLGVESVNVTNGRRRIVERADLYASDYVADDNGDLRLKINRPFNGVGNYTGEVEYYYRAAGERGWERFPRNLEGFAPVAVDSRTNMAYGFVEVNGFDTLQAVSLDGSSELQPVVARDDVDVDSTIRIGRQRRLVGASYATEKREIVYLDEDLATLARQLGNALPGQPLIYIVGASADEQQLLIVASSDTDPGTTYLLDRGTNELSPLLSLRPQLDGRQMAPMQPVSFTAADGTQIPGYLTMPPGREGAGKAIVMPHGGPGARDEWGFDWLVQFFAARGYAVLQPNFRGSSGYGSAWFGRNGFQAWETAIGDVNDAGKWLISEGIADPEKLAIVGWSYGGYAALQSQVVDSSLYKAVVAIAPVTDLDDLKDQARFYRSHANVIRFVGTGPHVEAGSPADHADQFEAPVMLFHGTNDLNVNVAQSRLMNRRLEDAGKVVKYVEYDGLDHSLGQSNVRANMLYEAAQFLAEHIPE